MEYLRCNIKCKITLIMQRIKTHITNKMICCNTKNKVENTFGTWPSREN
uniref:Uncharacterized protein n=1 Tax=Rhizophora mucronata TaxID=61149 RepID=A0A2P2N1C6_RHIMU